MNPSTVVAAIIKKDNFYLIVQRNKHKYLGLKWEFPGGKVEFGETFKEVLTVTPQTYIIKMRIHYACVDLMKTKKALKKIAADIGFYDHSTFIRQFTKHMGMLPNKYRKIHKKK